jgi:hypothetical protein
VATVWWQVRLVGKFVTGLVCFSFPTRLPTNTFPYWMTSETRRFEMPFSTMRSTWQCLL